MPKALSLKYRPSKFSDLIGQESVSQTLSLALTLDKVSHAYLFSGLRGSGKTSSARIFARALQCEKFPAPEPCNECASCKAAMDGSHLDIIEMDAASSRGIDDIKSLIEQIAYPPSFGRFKIFIIDEIHMLTKEAFNAFLKTLEEPPSYVKFILATTDPMKLPVTILSRTQHFRFKKIAVNAIEEHLKRILQLENVAFEDSAINLLSRNCGGSLRDAMTNLEQAIIFSKENITLQSISAMLGSLNPTKIDEFFSAILERNDDKIDTLLSEFEAYEAENVLNEMIDFLKNKLLEKNPKFGLVILERFFKILGEAKNMLNINADSGFVLLLSALKMKESLKIQDIDRVISKLEREVLDNSQNLLDSANQTKIAESNAKNAESANISSLRVSEANAAIHRICEQSEATIQKNNNIDCHDSASQNLAMTGESNADSTPKNQTDSAQKFQKLIEKIYERDYDLGKLFGNNISFVNLENGILTWESRADSATKEKLKPFFKIIKELVNEVFGEVAIQNAESKNAESTADSSKVVEMVESIFDITKKERV
ncbi:DNA polymerase III subunit gamma/tau [Helicobacter sp. 23-1045]